MVTLAGSIASAALSTPKRRRTLSLERLKSELLERLRSEVLERSLERE